MKRIEAVVEQAMFSTLSPEKIVQEFNHKINTRDLEGLSEMLTPDHTFIDSSQEVHQGRELMITNWKTFFELYPDYQNHFRFLKTQADLVIVLGHSTCSFSALAGPAIWTARVVQNRIAEWRVYLDNEANRRMLKLPLDL